jgi:hypothetical protein
MTNREFEGNERLDEVVRRLNRIEPETDCEFRTEIRLGYGVKEGATGGMWAERCVPRGSEVRSTQTESGGNRRFAYESGYPGLDEELEELKDVVAKVKTRAKVERAKTKKELKRCADEISCLDAALEKENKQARLAHWELAKEVRHVVAKRAPDPHAGESGRGGRGRGCQSETKCRTETLEKSNVAVTVLEHGTVVEVDGVGWWTTVLELRQRVEFVTGVRVEDAWEVLGKRGKMFVRVEERDVAAVIRSTCTPWWTDQGWMCRVAK